MKTISNEYKEQLRALGKEIDSIITIGETELTSEQINSANLHYEGNILKSVMKQLDLVLVDPLEKNTELNYKFGIKVNDEYEYIDYGTFIVYQCDKLEDTNTYQIKCYDKMLYSMTDYKNLNITYPITIKNYLQAICTKLGLTLKDDDFANQDREIQQELYLDSDGNSLGYKFRDVLDEIAQATGSTICINDNDELEVRYIKEAIINVERGGY